MFMKEREPQQIEELVTAENLVSKLNRNGFAVLEANDSFLGRLGEFFTDKLKPVSKRIAIPASVVLFAVTAAACSSGEASVNSVHNSDLSSATRISEIGQPEAIRRNSPPARVTTESVINLPKELPLPEGTSVVIGSCTSDGKCLPYNFYWAPTKEIVLQSGERENKLLHEACHAHQHWSINGGNRLEENDIDLESWYQTIEGQSFTNAVEGLPWPWTYSAKNGIEDFAWTCAYYYFDPHYLQDVSPKRYEWAAENLP